MWLLYGGVAIIFVFLNKIWALCDEDSRIEKNVFLFYILYVIIYLDFESQYISKFYIC